MAKNSKAKFIVPAVIGTILGLPILLIMLWSYGFTIGEEFSPDDFTQRRFMYNRMPIFHWILMGKYYDDITPDFQKSLIVDGLITPPPASSVTQTWHLCADSGGYGEQASNDVDARFLVEYLQLPGETTNSYWEQWNAKHPELAKIFWPVVADLARNEMYLAIPDIMRMALGIESVDNQADDVDAFSDRLTVLVNAAEARQALTRQTNGQETTELDIP